MNNIEFNELLKELKKSNTKKSLLLHSCCGPCSSSVLEKLLPYFDITIFYYNPNITPHDEFLKRVKYQEKIISCISKDIKIVVIDESHDVYLQAVKDYTNLGEGSMRCYKCYEFRLKLAAIYASNNHFDYYSSVMSVSPYKNSDWINELGNKYALDTPFLYSNFKKENGYQRSIELSKKFDLYRQDYCGCEFSKKEHETRICSKQTLS